MFVQDPVGRQAAQPSELSFSVTGDLVGTGLTWDGWGSPEATGTGEFVFDPAPHTHQVTIPGKVVLTDSEPCDDALYYLTARFEFEETPPFDPLPPALQTPCD